MLIEFLSQKPSRGIAFNRMFTMRQYPHDILPLYAQGYSLAKFLIQKEGKRYFLDYVAKGMANEKRMQLLTAWDRATHECYGFKDLSDLQLEWMEWVKLGCPNKLAAKTRSQNRYPIAADCRTEKRIHSRDLCQLYRIGARGRLAVGGKQAGSKKISRSTDFIGKLVSTTNETGCQHATKAMSTRSPRAKSRRRRTNLPSHRLPNLPSPCEIPACQPAYSRSPEPFGDNVGR